MSTAATRRPLSLTVVAIGFLLLPVGNYLVGSFMYADSMREASWLQRLDALGLFVLLLPLPIGVGLLAVQRWGWLLFMVYAPILILYNVRSLIRGFGWFSVGVLAQTVIMLMLVATFARRDFYAPFFAPGPRGFRRARRRMVNLQATVDSEARAMRDVSETGCYLYYPSGPLAVGTALRCQFELDGVSFDLRGKVVRSEPDGVGVQLTELSEADRVRLKASIG